MKNTYIINGMTCGGCVASVTKKLQQLPEITDVKIDLESKEVVLITISKVALQLLKNTLAPKYSIEFKNEETQNDIDEALAPKTKLQQLKPLLIIFAYLFSAAILMNIKPWNTAEAMLDFMGLFYIVFSFFKFLDLKGFPDSFKMYDPIAKLIPAYAWVYPFIELGLGLLFLFRFKITIALLVTIVILGATTIGVVRTLLDKKQIRCACLGTALKLPMTEATFIENAIMLVMAISMLIQLIN